MISKALTFIFLVVLCVVPVLGQDASTSSTVSFNGVGFSYDSSLGQNVTISQVPSMDEPVANAAHTEFSIYEATGDESQGIPNATVRIYRTSDLTGTPALSESFQTFQTLLTARGDLTPYVTVSDDGLITDVPFMRVPMAAQAVRGSIAYVDGPNVQGIRYLTVYRQDVSPFLGDEFVYEFQGLSLDGAYYVSATVYVSTDLFPAETPADFDFDAFTAGYVDYLNESIVTLNAADPAAFTPSLTSLDATIQSLTFGGTMAPETGTSVPTVAAPIGTATATEIVNEDSSLGGLAATWNLVSYGPPEAQVPALPNAPITLTFSNDGISGSAGCNSYGGSFLYNAGTITLTNIISTLMACEEPIMTQETTYLAALQTASAFQINGSQLMITYEGGVLLFNNAAAPVVTVPAEMTPTFTATIDPATLPTVTATATP